MRTLVAVATDLLALTLLVAVDALVAGADGAVRRAQDRLEAAHEEDQRHEAQVDDEGERRQRPALREQGGQGQARGA